MYVQIFDRYIKNLEGKYPSFSYVPLARIYVNSKTSESYDSELVAKHFDKCPLSNPFRIYPSKERVYFKEMKAIAKKVFSYNKRISEYYELKKNGKAGIAREFALSEGITYNDKNSKTHLGKRIKLSPLVKIMFKDVVSENPSSIVKEIINFNSYYYKDLAPGNKASLSNLKITYMLLFQKPAEVWAAVIRKRYKKLDHDNLINEIISIQNIQKSHLKNKTADIPQQNDDKNKTKSVYKPLKEGETLTLRKVTGKFDAQKYKEFLKDMEEYDKKNAKIRKEYTNKVLKEHYNSVPNNDTVDSSLITSTESDMIIKTCNKHKETLLDMEDSFHNIPTKRIYTCLHYDNNKPEKYCLDLQLIVDTWEHENDRYRIYSIGMAKIPISVNEMQDIAIHVYEYTKAVREYKEILNNDSKKAFKFARIHGLTYRKHNNEYGVGDFIELSPTVRYMLRDLRRKHPSILLQKIINLNFDNSGNPTSYDFRTMKQLYGNIASGNLNTIYSEIVQIISPYKELKKELEELQILFAGKRRNKNKSSTSDQNIKTYSLYDSLKNIMGSDGLKQQGCSNSRNQGRQQGCSNIRQQGYSPEKNYSCKCTCMETNNNNDSTLTLDYSTLKDSLMESLTNNTFSNTMSYFNPNSISLNDDNSLWIVM